MTDAERVELALRRTYGDGTKNWSDEMAVFIEKFVFELSILNTEVLNKRIKEEQK